MGYLKKKEQNMLTPEDVKELEEALIAKIEEIREEKGITSAALGRMAFPEAGNAVTKMQNIRRGRKETLTIGELIKIAVALGVDPVGLLSSVTFSKLPRILSK